MYYLSEPGIHCALGNSAQDLRKALVLHHLLVLTGQSQTLGVGGEGGLQIADRDADVIQLVNHAELRIRGNERRLL